MPKQPILICMFSIGCPFIFSPLKYYSMQCIGTPNISDTEHILKFGIEIVCIWNTKRIFKWDRGSSDWKLHDPFASSSKRKRTLVAVRSAAPTIESRKGISYVNIHTISLENGRRLSCFDRIDWLMEEISLHAGKKCTNIYLKWSRCMLHVLQRQWKTQFMHTIFGFSISDANL